MKYSELRKWLKNLSRTIVLIIGLILAILFYYKIHKIFAIVGVTLGSLAVTILPALIHN
jgi:Na+/proline symporter